nr:MAG TPA: hypothetical protein [Caudoviricetes sp.]
MAEGFITVICGVLVFVLGQLFMELFLKPLQRYKQLKSKLSYLLVKYYIQIINVRGAMNTVILKDLDNESLNQLAFEGREQLKEIAAELEGFLYEKWTVINFMFAKPKNIEKVVNLLLQVSGRMISADRLVDKANENNKLDVLEIKRIMKLSNNNWYEQF